ncbi:MAG TPA: VWA domain-containing protein, partial [Chloroflexota bacterium]|nr:VWA domain-containing protein [Chloroflexota bacterium]
MGFFAPSAFLIGAGLLVAILATYLLRPRRPARRVSSTLLWLAALNDVQAQQPWRRIPPSILLLLQIAILAALIGALARPFLRSTESTGPFSIVLLDASASMQATDVAPSRFEVARQRVAQTIDTLDSSEQMALISLDDQPHVVAPPTNDRTQLRRALDSMRPTTRSANLAAALSIAGALAAGHADAQITLVGDGSLDRTQVPASLLQAIPIRYIGVGSASPANLAVAGLATRVVNSQVSALARVINVGDQSAQATLTLRVDGARFDAQTVNAAAGETTQVQWDGLPGAARTLEARLDAGDTLTLDNAAWAVVGGDRPTRVLLVSDGNVFVERALGLRPGTEVTRVSPGDYVPRPQAFDLLVLDGFVPPVLPTGSNVWLLHPPPGNGLIAAGPDVLVSGFTAVHDSDPLLTDVPLGGVHISRARRIDPPAWADVVLTAPETPLLLVGQTQGRRVAVLGFDVHQSDLPLQPGFPVLTQHVLDWLVPRSSTATPVVQVGESVALSPLPESVSVEVIGPDGQRTEVSPPSPPAPFGATDQPGLYQVVQRDASGRETTTWFAANFLNPRESQLAPGTDSGAPPVGPRREPLQAPREFWPVLAAVGLALLAVELALAWWQ